MRTTCLVDICHESNRPRSFKVEGAGSTLQSRVGLILVRLDLHAQRGCEKNILVRAGTEQNTNGRLSPRSN